MKKALLILLLLVVLSISVSASGLWDIPNLFVKAGNFLYPRGNESLNVTGGGANISATNYLNASGALNWIRPENIFDVDLENICLPGEFCPFVLITGDNMTGPLQIENDGTNVGLIINQDGNGIGLSIDSEATTAGTYALSVETGGGATTADFRTGSNNFVQLAIAGDSTRTNWFYRDLTSATTNGPLLFIEQDNNGDDQNVLNIQQDGNGTALRVLQSGILRNGENALQVTSGVAQINHELVEFRQQSASTTSGVFKIQQDGSGYGLTIDENGNGNPLVIDNIGTSADIITGTNQILRIVPNNNITQIGDAGTTSRSLTANDDLFVSGKFEADGISYFDNEVFFRDFVHYDVDDITYLTMRGINDDGIHFSVRGGTNRANYNVILTTWENRLKDNDHDTLSSDPRFYFQGSADPDVDNTRWGYISHEQNSTLNIVTGGDTNLTFTPGSGLTKFIGNLTVDDIGSIVNPVNQIYATNINVTNLGGLSIIQVNADMNFTNGIIYLSDFSTSSTGGALVVKRSNANGALFGIENDIAGANPTSGAGYVTIQDCGNYTVDAHSSEDTNNPSSVVHHLRGCIAKEIWRLNAGNTSSSFGFERSLNNFILKLNRSTVEVIGANLTLPDVTNLTTTAKYLCLDDVTGVVYKKTTGCDA